MATDTGSELARRVETLEARARETQLAASYARAPTPEAIALHVELAKLPFRLAETAARNLLVFSSLALALPLVGIAKLLSWR